MTAYSNRGRWVNLLHVAIKKKNIISACRLHCITLRKHEPILTMDDSYIYVKGARVNNLKNIDVAIPRDKFVVITGLSGSGKSSLAFDTLYAEGQRRYVESLSSYARQFLGRMKKPECDFIEGIPPAIAIEQKVTTRNPRSTVGTSTEIYDYLRMLFARVGKTYSPVSGRMVKKQTVEDVVACVLSHERGARFVIEIKLEGKPASLKNALDEYLKQGFSRVDIDGQMMRIGDVTADMLGSGNVYLIIDRMACSDEADELSRLRDSLETAFFEGNGACELAFMGGDEVKRERFSVRFEEDGMTFDEPSDLMFSFNSPYGACPVCEGFGKVIGIDEHLVIPNTAMSIYDGAVVCWRGEKMGEWRSEFIRAVSSMDFPIFSPYYELTREQKDLLWHGAPGVPCLDDFFKMLEENQYKVQYRVMLARYRGKTVCPACHGNRLKKEAGFVKVGGKNIFDLVNMPVTELQKFFLALHIDDSDYLIAKRILTEIENRLSFLVNVGLGYLTLNRLSNTLSGGESQRINLVTSLGSSLVGSLYILDEPSIGLHSRDTDKLVSVLRQLQQIGNTVVVVEHDEDIIRKADYIIDVGPEAGVNGGRIVYQGCMDDLESASGSHTVDYLLGKERIPVPEVRRRWNNYIKVVGARENNLKGITVKFPLNVMTVVTGVSGSGKSTLVNDIFYCALNRELVETEKRPGEFIALEGDINLVRNIEFVDQNPIGKSSRSNPVTYIKVYDDIRKLFASQPYAKQMGFTPASFSFNVPGGRCEECKGEGTVTVEMQFMADLVLECESCHGRRFKSEILELEYNGKNICDILDMSVDEAIDFFGKYGQAKIVKKLRSLQDVGLGYVKLGQSSSTLSGGENQRVKLAYYLGLEKDEHTVFIFDEPTTGLHFHDIKKLLKAFDALIAKGHTVVVIEHNMDVIKCADYIIDLGPEGGDKGGYIVACGTPEEVASCSESYTGKYLAEKLSEN